MNVTGAIRSASVLQMLKHGRAGVPMEVMGLMLGEFVDDYTVRVIDVFAMPQSGTVSTAAILGSFLKCSCICIGLIYAWRKAKVLDI